MCVCMNQSVSLLVSVSKNLKLNDLVKFPEMI